MLRQQRGPLHPQHGAAKENGSPRAYQPANAKASTNLQAIADLRDLTNRGRVTVDIDAEPTRSSLPQRKAHKHIQLH